MQLTMKSVLSLLFLFTIFVGIQSAVFVEKQPPIKGHEGQCYDKVDNVFYKKNEEMKWKGKECGRKLCLGAYIEYQTCGKVAITPECRFVSNPSLPYPKCCGWVICPPRSTYPPDSENELE